MALPKHTAHNGCEALPGLKTAGTPGVDKEPGPAIDIIDIRGAAIEMNLKDDVLSMFFAERGPRKMPTLLLYDEKGLQLFEEVGPFEPVAQEGL